MRGCSAVLILVAGLLILSGLSGWVGNGGEAGAYQAARHERLSSTVVAAESRYVTDPGARRSQLVCFVSLEGGYGTRTVRIDNLSGACDAPSPLRPGSAVEAEFWKGKITTVFAGDQSFTTADNPVHNASVAVLSLAAGIAIGTLALAILAVQFAIARIRSPAAKSGIIATRAERPHLWPRMEAAAAAPADLGMTAAVLSVAGFPVGLISVGVVFPRPEGWTFFQNAAFLAAAALEFVAMTTVTDRLAKRFATQLLTPGGRVFTLAWQGLAFVAQVATWLLVGHAVQ